MAVQSATNSGVNVLTVGLFLTQRSPYASYREMLSSLSETLERYCSWEDRLSLELFAWGVEAAQMPEDSPIESVVSKISQLIALLRNPIDGAMLRSPYYAGGEVWEQWMLEEYIAARRAAGLPITSPFDASQGLTLGTEHRFAKEMLLFLSGVARELISSDAYHTESDFLRQSDFARLAPHWKVMILYQKAQIAKARWDLAASHTRRLALECLLEGRVSTSVASIRAQVDEIREEAHRGLRAVRSSYQDAAAALENNLGTVRENLEQEQIENRRNAARAANAEASVAALQARVAALEGRDDGFCSIM